MIMMMTMTITMFRVTKRLFANTKRLQSPMITSRLPLGTLAQQQHL